MTFSSIYPKAEAAAMDIFRAVFPNARPMPYEVLGGDIDDWIVIMVCASSTS